MAATGIPLLQARGLTREFGGGPSTGGPLVRAVDGVDLDVWTGETLGLVGESGCGKTTLARLLLRLLEPTSGTVRFDGVDLATLEPRALRLRRREIQMVFQDPAASLDPRRTVEEVLAEPYETQRIGTGAERRCSIKELLSAVALDPALGPRRALSLSGGEQQRVVIARALALRPRLVVADEPVAALDASIAAQILNLLSDLQQRFRLTMVVVSHSLGVVRHLSTRIAVMNTGRIVETAEAGEFFRAPKHPYSRLLLESARFLYNAVGSESHQPETKEGP